MNRRRAPIPLLAASLLLLSASFAQAMPPIQHWQTERGARVYFLELPQLPMVDIQALFDAGSAREGDLPAGNALLTATLLSEGSGGRLGGAVSAAFENRGARFGSNVSHQYAVFSLRSLTDPKLLEPVLENFTAVLAEPDFPGSAFERERKRLLVSVRGRRQDPGALAEEAFYGAVFKGHPYASQVEGDETSVQAITLEDLRGFYQKYYHNAGLVLAIAGAVDRKQAERIAERISSSLPVGQAPPPIQAATNLEQARQVCVRHPSTQAHLLLGQPAIRRTDPDYYALFTGNHLLGGNMVSLLFEEIRERHGLAYSVYSYFRPLRGRGPFVTGMQTRADQAEEALEMLRTQLRDFVQNGPNPEALEATKHNIIGGFPLRIDSNGKLARYLGLIGFLHLPLDYLEQFPRKVQALTAQQVHEAFRRHLEPDKLVTVMVGPWNPDDPDLPCTEAQAEQAEQTEADN